MTQYEALAVLWLAARFGIKSALVRPLLEFLSFSHTGKPRPAGLPCLVAAVWAR